MIDILSLFQESKVSGKNAVLCLITNTIGSTPRKIGSKMLVYADGSDYDLIEDAAMQCGGKVSLYFEPAQSPSKLYIFGAGHIGKVLSRYANEFSFQVFLIDNRPEVMPEVKINGIHYLCGDYQELLSNLSFDSKTFVVATTHKHTHDEEIIAFCLQKPYAYLGMMASKRKAILAKKNWKEIKDLEIEKIDKVFAPIGVPIHCETPEEISISVLAQLIDFKNKLDEK